MIDREPHEKTMHAVPPAGENLSDEQRRQLEKKSEAEHQDGEEREKTIEEAESLEGE